MPAPVYINDPSGNTWQLSVNDNGWLETITATPGLPGAVVIADPILGQCWLLQAGDGGFITATTVPPTPFQTVVLQAPLGGLWQLGVLGEDLITFPAGAGMIPPKIIWPSGGANVLQMANWPRYVPAPTSGTGLVANYIVYRPDNLFSGGQGESIYSRTDQYWEGTMEFVPAGSTVHKSWGTANGIVTWAQFMSYALRGGNFDFYPNGAGPQFTTYLLDLFDWNAAYQQMGEYTFPLRFKLYVAP